MSERKVRQLSELNLMDNFLFGSVVSHPEIGEKFCRYVLGIILQREIPKVTVSGQKAIYGRDTRFHGIRIDVEIKEEAEGNVGTVYDMEPDLKEYDKQELPYRTRHYHSLIDSRTLKTGAKYSRLPHVYVIMITDFDPFGEDRMVYTMKNTYVEKPGLPYEDGERTIYLYTKGTEGNPPKELRELLAYMEKTSRENAVNSVLREIDEMVKSVKEDSEVTVGYMHWVVTEEDIFDRGKAEGRKEGIRETVLPMISVLRKNGFSDEKIIEILVEDCKLPRDTAEQYVNKKK